MQASLENRQARGDLLLLFYSVTDCVWIVKLVFESGDRLENVDIRNNIGNDAWFLGRNQSVCVSVSDYPKCHSNSIYMDDRILELEDIEEGVHYCSFENLHEDMQQAIWIKAIQENSSRNIFFLRFFKTRIQENSEKKN